jgi:PAS domain S-box-containing protein
MTEHSMSPQSQMASLESRLLNQIALVHETNCAGVITRVNAVMCSKTGFTPEELIGSTHRVIQPDLALDSTWLQLHAPTAGGDYWSGETLNRTKDCSDLWLATTAAPILASDGSIVGYSFASIDISEQKKLHEEFQRSGKLMQLGQLTAMVAHEIRNPLGAIRTANYVLERKLNGQVAGVEPQLERINVSIRRCDKIITELLDFSKKKTVNASVLPVDSWLAETVDEISKTLAASPHVTAEYGLGALEASFDPEQMRQVVINLLSNAAEAMGEKVKSGTAEADYQPAISIRTRKDGPHIQIVVSDNGPGIEPKNIKRVREPLFTTKSFGVGLGISAIEKILQDHRGSLGIESAPGAGATMTASFHQNGAGEQSAA